MIYYLVWSFVAIMTVTGCYKKNARKRMSLYIIITIVLFAGLRYDRWSDWEQYFLLFENYGSIDSDLEIGFRFINWLGKTILVNYNLFLCVIYAIVLSLLRKEYRDVVPKYETLCIMILLSTSILSSGGIRQFIASAITFYSMRFVRKKKIIPFLLTIAIASLFHRSAVIFLPVFWIDRLHIKFKTFIYIAIVGFAFGYFNVFKLIINAVLPYLKGFGGIYYRVNFYMHSIDNIQVFSFGIMKRTLVMMLILFINKYAEKSKSSNETMQLYINLYTVGYLLSLFVPGTFARMNGYFYSAEPIVEGLALLNIKNPNVRFIVFCFIIMMNLAIWINTLHTFYPELLFPYKSCLF